MEESFFLKKCKLLIEAKIKWQASSNWKNRDYENLTEIIFKETDILLSVSTLKRIWKDDFDGIPQINTLNALANFIGFKSWADFKSSIPFDDYIGKKTVSLSSESEKQPLQTNRKNKKWKLISLIAAILIFPIILIIFNKEEIKIINLKLKTSIPKGVPNTVIFEYQTKGYNDSLFFQPSWNRAERKLMNPESNLYTAIYYFPGYHEAKILSGEKILKSVKIKIETDGWFACVRYNPYDIIPVYLPKTNIYHNQFISVDKKSLKAAGVKTENNNYWTSYFNIKNFDKIESSGFSFETTIANPLREGALTCQICNIYLYFENGAIVIPMGDKGCSNRFSLLLFDKGLSGEYSDLSAFGCNLNEWCTFKLEIKKNTAYFFINNINIYSVKFEKSVGKLQGIHYMFYGTGKIKNYVLFGGNGKPEYSENL